VCIAWFDTDDLMKHHSSIRVVRMWCSICTDPVLRCFDNLEGLSYENLLIDVVSELLNWLTV
jgi:hypothetical protein